MASNFGRLAVVVGLVVLAAAQAPVSFAAPQTGAVYVVTRTDDPAPGGCATNDCSLREAVLAADNNPGVDTIRLSHYTTYQLTIAQTGADDAHSGDLNITESVNFDFGDACIAFTDCSSIIRGGTGWHDRVFNLQNNSAVSLDKIAIENGHTTVLGGGINIEAGSALTLTNSFVMSNTAAMDAGGILNNGALTLENTVVSHNTAQQGGGGVNSSFTAAGLVIDNSAIDQNQALNFGGGLAVFGNFTLRHSVIALNKVINDSGGLYFDGGGLAQANIVDSGVSLNTTGPTVDITDRGIGGGIFATNGVLNVTDSIVNTNSAGCGGGIGTWEDANVQVADSTVKFNNVSSGGGGLCDVGLASSSTYSVTNSTISGNSSKKDGGGLDIESGGLYNVTLTNNTADSDHDGIGDGGGAYVQGVGQLDVANSILAGNVDTGGQAPECAGNVLHSLGYNLIQGVWTCALIGSTTGNKPGQDPLLGVLTFNGGNTTTQALLPGSPAINAGNPAGCRDGLGHLLSADQRGDPRWFFCDMGAFEYQPAVHFFLPLMRR